MAQAKNKKNVFDIKKYYPWILAIASFIGFFASFTLTIEKIAILKDPNHHLSCSLNPLFSCGPIITSPEASAFGFPNPLIGIFAFSVLFSVAMAMFAGSVVDKAKRWYWNLYIVGHLFGLGFIVWLMSEAFYELKALCIYCMVAWAVTIVLNWYGFLWMVETGRLQVSKKLMRFKDWGLNNHWGVVLLCYIVIFGLILFAFEDYFRSVWF